MKSTKYQLLEDDFRALKNDIRLYRQRIDELEKEVEKWKKLYHKVDPVGYLFIKD